MTKDLDQFHPWCLLWQDLSAGSTWFNKSSLSIQQVLKDLWVSETRPVNPTQWWIKLIYPTSLERLVGFRNKTCQPHPVVNTLARSLVRWCRGRGCMFPLIGLFWGSNENYTQMIPCPLQHTSFIYYSLMLSKIIYELICVM